MMTMRRLHNSISTWLAIIALAAILVPIFFINSPWPTTARDYLQEHGSAESGAINLVSAIYLGYRVFDTFGETIVLLVSILGTMGLLSQLEHLVEPTRSDQQALESTSGFALAQEKRRSHTLRTHLLEVVTGKVGPIVLLFGFYVMLYGHISPGGGFQGGVIVASGIVFLSLGNPQEGSFGISRPQVLIRLEILAFFTLIVIFCSGLITGSGFFGNPLAQTQFPVAHIVLLNAVIGLKVGMSIGSMCIAMMGERA
jgi:multicomponent Na+:H+ antiporter subunit B